MKKKLFIPLGLGISGLIFYFILRGIKTEAAEPPLPHQLDFIEEVASDYYRQRYGATIPQETASEIATSLTKWTEERNLNLFTSLAIITQESYFAPFAFGPDGEKGLWQLSEVAMVELESERARERLGLLQPIKVNRNRLYDVDYNTEIGTLYYLYCIKLAEGDRREAIARYHKTTEYWRAWDYADEVLEKRARIVAIYQLLAAKASALRGI